MKQMKSVSDSSVWGQSRLTHAVMITTELYWMQLEITLGLLAACMPTLRGLCRTKSVDSVVRGVRSLFSVRSGSSSGSIKNSLGNGPDSDEKSRQITVTVNNDIRYGSRGSDRV